MHYTVYKVVNTINGCEYIGKHQTGNLNDGYIGSGKTLRRAVRKHGKDAFVKQILFVFSTEKEMNDKEAELVTEEYCKSDTNYNLKPGGSGGFALVDQRKGSKAGALRRQELLKNPEFRESVRRAAIKGYSCGIGQMSDIQRKSNAKYARSKRTNVLHTSESKRRISAANKGRGMGNQNRSMKVDIEGHIFPSMKIAAEHFNVSGQTISRWVKTGKGRKVHDI